MRKVFAFLSCIIFSNCECLDLKTLERIINANEPIQIVTLTRVPVDKEGNPKTEDSDYSPITVTEAATVFEIANFLLGHEDFEAVHRSVKFDKSIFQELNKVDHILESDTDRLDVAQDALKREKCIADSSSIQSAILDLIKSNKDFCVRKIVRIKLKGGY